MPRPMLGTVVVTATVLAFLACGPIVAQFDVNGPGAMLTINDLVPSAADAATHQVPVAVPGNFRLRITSGMNGPQGLILVAGPLAPATFSTPWGGTLDLGIPNPVPPFIPGGLTVVVDTIFNSASSPFTPFAVTPFLLTFGVGATLAGANGPGLQSIVTDPTAPPFFLDSTEAGQPRFEAVTVTTYSSIADDDFVTHTLDQSMMPSPVSIAYGGVAYTQVFIGSNGEITFGAGDGDFSPSLSEFFAGFQTAPTATPNPGVCVWQDMARGTLTNDSIVVREDRAANTVEVAYLNQEHWDSQLPSGDFCVTFGSMGPNSVTFDLTGFIVGDPNLDAGPLVGCTAGDDTTSSNRTSDLSVDIGASYLSVMSPESIGEDFNPTVTLGGSLDVGQFTFIDVGNGMMGSAFFKWLLM